ncbi:SapC family protein [Desulfonatronovibrio magnus]|uniref:SapC family protein n=1 Tax=Desulfonatronovibrio magnus TaxID=698827 RepID=UPI000695DEE9|nr:SapC family protein [Desulfonatronovibrio magnus]
MQKLIPVNPETMAGKSWKRYETYFYAQNTPVLPLVGSELFKAVHAMPIALMKQNDKFVPAAVLGVEPGKSLFVNDLGQWRGSYVPSALRGYPFRLVSGEEKDKLILCIFEDSGLITDGPDGEPFFDDQAQPAPELQKIMDFLKTIEVSRRATETACKTLEELDLIVPWSARSEDMEVKGIFKIDEEKMNALPDQDYLKLRQNGAILIAYCQLLSEQHIDKLFEFAREGQQSEDDFSFLHEVKFQ